MCLCRRTVAVFSRVTQLDAAAGVIACVPPHGYPENMSIFTVTTEVVNPTMSVWVAFAVMASAIGSIAGFAIGRPKARESAPEEVHPLCA